MGYRVLILEDNEVDARLLKTYLKRSGEAFDEIDHVENREEYEQYLSKKDATELPDLIISDYRLPQYNGLQALRFKNSIASEIPFIIVSATIGEENAVEVIKEGAVDFIIKNHAKKRLAQVAIRAIRESNERKKRIRAEERLKEMRTHYQLLISHSLDGIIVGDPEHEGKILDTNNALCEMLGYTREELLGMNRSTLLAEEPEMLQNKNRYRELSGKFRGEILMRRKDGSTVPVETSSTIAELADGSVRSLSIIRDISDRKEAEKALLRKNNIQKLHKDVAEIINRSSHFGKALEDSIVRINEFLGWELGHIYLRHTTGKAEEFRSSEVWDTRGDHHFHNFKKHTQKVRFKEEEKGLVGLAAREQDILWLSESLEGGKEFIREDVLHKENLKEGLLIPIVVNGNTEAVYEFYTTSDGQQNGETEQILKTLALQISQLLERQISLDILKKEKEKFRLLAENSTDMISRHSPEGTYLYASPASRNITGFEPGELIGKDSYELFHPDDLDKVSDSHRTILVDKNTMIISYRIRQKNGDWRWVETTSRTLRDEEGEVYEIQAATRDITERIRFENELQDQLKLNEKVINSLPGIFFIITEDGQVIRVNEKLREMLGFDDSREDKFFTHFIYHEDLDKADRLFRDAFENGYTEGEIRVLDNNEEPVPFLMSSVVDTLGDDKFLIGTGIDIGQRVKAEKELIEAKTFTDHTINALPGLFYTLHKSGRFVRINDNFIEQLGYSEEEINKMNPLDFYLKEDHETVTQAINKAFEEGSANLIARIRTKNGDLPWYYLTGKYLRQNGEDYILGTGIDISEQKHLEKLLNDAQRLARIGAWEYDLNNESMHWTNVAKDIHELEMDEEPNLEQALNYYQEEDHEFLTHILERAINEGIPFDEEFLITTEKGNKRWIRTIGKPEFTDGECVKLYGSFQDIHARKKAEEQVLASLKEKETLLMEIHHRVKNNLALVSGIMQLQAFNTDNDEVFSILHDAQSRIKSIAITHELLYQSENFSDVDLQDTFSKLIEHLQRSNDNGTSVSWDAELQRTSINVNQALPCSLLVNEVLTNIYKHAFQDMPEGTIGVQVQAKEDIIEILIHDNGIGLPDGFDFEQAESVGMTLIKTLTEQLNGSSVFISTEGGTEFRLTFRQQDVKGSASAISRKNILPE